MGKAFEALKRSGRERGHQNPSKPLSPPLSPGFSADDDPAAGGPIAGEAGSPTDLDGRYKILKASRSIHKKLLFKIKAGTIRDIFSCRYFLTISDPIRIVQIRIFQYQHHLCYNLLCNTKVVLSIFLDRFGRFVSIDLNPRAIPSIEPNGSGSHALLDLPAFKNMSANMIQTLFDEFDRKRLKAVLTDMFAIGLDRDISCENGGMVAIDGRLLYEFTLKSAVAFSLLLTTGGNFIGVSFSDDPAVWNRILREHFGGKTLFQLNLFNHRR